MDTSEREFKRRHDATPEFLDVIQRDDGDGVVYDRWQCEPHLEYKGAGVHPAGMPRRFIVRLKHSGPPAPR